MPASLTQWFHRPRHGGAWIPSSEHQAQQMAGRGFEVKKCEPVDEHPDVARMDLVLNHGLRFESGPYGFGLYDQMGFMWAEGSGREALDRALKCKVIG